MSVYGHLMGTEINKLVLRWLLLARCDFFLLQNQFTVTIRTENRNWCSYLWAHLIVFTWFQMANGK